MHRGHAGAGRPPADATTEPCPGTKLLLGVLGQAVHAQLVLTLHLPVLQRRDGFLVGSSLLVPEPVFTGCGQRSHDVGGTSRDGPDGGVLGAAEASYRDRHGTRDTESGDACGYPCRLDGGVHARAR